MNTRSTTTITFDNYNPDNSSERYFKHNGKWIDFFDVDQHVRRTLIKIAELMQHGDKLTVTIDVQSREESTT